MSASDEYTDGAVTVRAAITESRKTKIHLFAIITSSIIWIIRIQTDIPIVLEEEKGDKKG